MFDRTYVVNLDRRPDRFASFLAGLPADWPFPAPERIAAVDGAKVPHPKWWRQGRGAWGCYRSHLAIVERALNEDLESVLILEDDAVFGPDFTAAVRAFLPHVPPDWQMLYLGGQLLKTAQHKPRVVNERVLVPWNVNRTHAFALRGREFMGELYRHLHDWQHWKRGHHVDHHFGLLHEAGRHAVYCPAEWLVGQAAGASDIKAGRKQFPQRYWPAPAAAAGKRALRRAETQSTPQAQPETLPPLLILGLHSSGSSALAGVCYHLGCHMGSKLGGYYGSDPARACGFEAAKLARICEAAIPFPATGLVQGSAVITNNLAGWLRKLVAEAARTGTVGAGKYPLLCGLRVELLAAIETIGCGLRVVHIERPLDESIASLVRRCPHRKPGAIEAHQRWLQAGKLDLLAHLPADRLLEVTYDDLLADPLTVAGRLAAFAGLDVGPERIARAAAYVDAGKRHVHPAALSE